MTDFTKYRSSLRDMQDHAERGMFGKVTHVAGAGSHMTVRGTGTLDEEVPVWQGVQGFNLPADSNAEVVMLALGADVNNKIALPSLPRDKQHPWGEGEGGLQSPTDPNRRIEFNGDETYLKDGVFVLGHDRAVTVTVSGSNVQISVTGDANISTVGAMKLTAETVEIESATLTHNGKDIGENHKHGGVDTGGGTSGVPV